MGMSPFSRLEVSPGEPISVPHGTTILAFKYADGVVMAGDRRATEGNFIAHRRIEKVFAADRYSGVAIAGAAGPAVEMVRLFQTQLEHYEKVEGVVLSLEGKANQLGQMIRANLPMAMQGLAVVPLFAGWDHIRSAGRIFAYDVTGGKYEEVAFQATGSGGRDAKGTIKAGLKGALLDRSAAINLAVSALVEASEEDSATGGPDLHRGIFPVVATITEVGFVAVPDEELEEIARNVLEARRGIGGGQ
ncbi:MAG: proteasome subunit beta [Actinomycetota bacterium]|nr:proteasome subunit beta [Actinomycetota bacterium]